MNASLGGAGGMPVTSVERLTFLEMEIPLVSVASPNSGDVQHSEKGGTSSMTQIAPGSRALYEFVIPAPPDGQLLPARPPHEFDMSTVSIVWSLKFTGVRKGLLRRNDSLSLDLPVVFPGKSHSLPSSVVANHPFKFDTGQNDGMELQAHLAPTPITHRSPIHATLLISPSSASAAHLLRTSSPSLKVDASISRQTRTTPVVRPNAGRSFEWAGVRVISAPMAQSKDNQWKWEGTLEPPEGECSIESPAVAVSYKLNCHIISPVLAQAALHVAVPIFIPSLPFDPNLMSSTTPSTGELPAYTAS